MLPLIQAIAVLATTIFAGAAIYINLVEHPARMGCSTELAATQWAPSYKRATVMQAPLAVIGSLSGIAAWWLGSGLSVANRRNCHPGRRPVHVDHHRA